MRKLLPLLFFSIITLCLQAQNNELTSFDRLEPQGEMPEYFKQVLQKKESKSNVSTKEVELLNEKFVYSVLMSGKALYGDPVTQYLNQLLEKILENKPELWKEIRIFALKSEQVNAFSTPQGTIFVNLGLIANCSNEAELAFIICHELAHYTKNAEDKLKYDPSKINDIDYYLKYHAQSREQELQADKFGFLEFFKDLGYSFEVIEKVFDMLQYSNLPFGEKKFTREFFENDYFQLDSLYFPTQINPVSSRENYVDTLSTHPNILNRRLEMRKITRQFSNTASSQKTAYFDKEFQEAKMWAQFESINQMIIHNKYLYAYFNSCALQDLYPQHPFLKQTEAAALYALYRLKTTDSYQKNVGKASGMRGDIYFPAYVLEKMNKKEFAVWALRTLWKALQANPYNDYLTLIFNDMVKEVVNKVENNMLADLKKDTLFLDTFELGILAAEREEVNKLISRYRNNSKEKIPITVFHPYVELKGVTNNEKKTEKQIVVFENECEKIANTCRFIPHIISGISYNFNYSYPIYVRLLELESNINRIIPLAYETRQSDQLCNVLGTSYVNFVTLSKMRFGLGGGNIAFNAPFTALSVFLFPAIPLAVLSWIPKRYNANTTFVLYDLKSKKYLFNTARNISITDKSELYQTLFENYSDARKTIKQ